MRRLVFVAVLLLCVVSAAFGQTRNINAGYLITRLWLENYGYYSQVYRGRLRDAFRVNYSGSGHYLLRLQGNGSNVFTVGKSGNVWAGGMLEVYEDSVTDIPALVLTSDDPDLQPIQLLIRGLTDNNKHLVLGLNTTNDYGILQAVHQYVSFLPLGLNPQGGNVGIRCEEADTTLEVSDDYAASIVTISTFNNAEATASALTLRKADGTRASPSAIDQDAILGTINFNGRDNDGWDTGAAIYSIADANWGAAERGTDMFFQTRDGAGALTDQFKITAGGDFKGVTSKWWYCTYIGMIEVSPGGSGATWTAPDANTIGGYRLNAANDYLYFSARVCPNWDAASDIRLGVVFEVNVDNTGGGDADTVDLQLLCYYKGQGDTSSKTQTLEIPVTVGKSPQYKAFSALFTVDYDAVANVVDVYDVLSFRLNLETDTSEVDNVIANFAAFAFKTKTGFIEISAAP